MATRRTKPLLILASASPRRFDLLGQIGVIPDAILPAELDETPEDGEQPGQLVERLAIVKAKTAITQRSAKDEGRGVIALGADTVVACGRGILSKARDEADAFRSLKLLSGRRHRVYTGVAVADSVDNCRHRVVKTTVTMKRLEEREILAYLKCREWQSTAGAYGIQGRAAAFVRFINGSYSNVVGLPLYETSALLNAAGYTVPAGDCEYD